MAQRECSRLVSLGPGELMTISGDELSFCESLSEKLNSIVREGGSGSMTSDNVIKRLDRRSGLDFEISREAEFIPSHFFEIEITWRMNFISYSAIGSIQDQVQ
jgi:hypothetical protein